MNDTIDIRNDIKIHGMYEIAFGVVQTHLPHTICTYRGA